MRRSWAAAVLVALLAGAACSGGDDSSGADGEAASTTDVEETTTSEPDLDAQLEAVQAAFDLTVAERTVMFFAYQSARLPDGFPTFAASIQVDSGSDRTEDHGAGAITLTLLDGPEPPTSTTEVRSVDGTVWIGGGGGWLGWTDDAPARAAAMVDTPGLLVAFRDSIDEVVAHSPMVAGSDQWAVVATPPFAVGLMGEGPTEMTVKTRTGGVLSTIEYTVEVSTEQVTELLPELADQLAGVPTVTFEVEIHLEGIDGPLRPPAEQPCPAPEPVSGPEGASLRCPAAG